MRKAQIQQTVREHLAMIGYAPGDFGWPKRGQLRILVNAQARLDGGARAGENPMGGAYVELRLPAGKKTKRATLEAALASIPVRGPSRPVARVPSASNEMQREML